MKLKYHHLFLTAIPIVLIYILLFSNSALDVQFHDTYFVITYFYIGIVMSILLAVFGVVYWWMKKKNFHLKKGMSIAHILLTFAFFAFLLFNIFRPVRNDYLNGAGLVFTNMVLLFILGQLLFLVNIGISIFEKNKSEFK